MSDIKILQVNIDGMSNTQGGKFCETLSSKIPDVLIIPHRGESGKITVINGIDIVYVNSKEMTGEELYSAVEELEGLKEENQSLKEQICELNDQLMNEYSKCWDENHDEWEDE